MERRKEGQSIEQDLSTKNQTNLPKTESHFNYHTKLNQLTPNERASPTCLPYVPKSAPKPQILCLLTYNKNETKQQDRTHPRTFPHSKSTVQHHGIYTYRPPMCRLVRVHSRQPTNQPTKPNHPTNKVYPGTPPELPGFFAQMYLTHRTVQTMGLADKGGIEGRKGRHRCTKKNII
ncbi:hypothetical protein L873DRAFT_1260073 [Choiromyces venosus 120613-1]|uniref:Uncharacterized protein n=1 Tax=Choiromyces venosus 120613-1 TaxID=1336337 RepID=A0A3N4JCQ9_9PEZI|nr:hypothetical protein L873DRAFT_1260073 [Choiromyces venosus 120613-1]